MNEAPTDIEIHTFYMKENLSPGAFISNITMADEDENTVTTCSLLDDGGGRIALNGTSLVAGEKNTDYEQLTSRVIEITLRCCDQLEECINKTFNISVQGKAGPYHPQYHHHHHIRIVFSNISFTCIDVNEPPTDINIDNLQVMENEKDISIGKISISDPDSYSDYHCSLSADNQTSHLTIINSNKTLHLIKEFNFEEEQMVMFEIICREKGNSSMYFTKQFDLRIIDVNEAPSRGCETPLYTSNEQSLGTVISKVLASDPDNINSEDPCQPKQELTYKQTGSEENLPFKIIGGYLVKTGDVESTKYTFEVSVQDDGVIFAKNFTKICVARKTTMFNCTIISRSMIGPQVTLSSNQIQEGSPNASTIGYLGTKAAEQQNMKYELMKDQCDNYPFVIEGNRLMLMLSSCTGPKTEEDYIVPRYAMVLVKTTAAESPGHSNYTRFAIFIKGKMLFCKEERCCMDELYCATTIKEMFIRHQPYIVLEYRVLSFFSANAKTHNQICFSTSPVRLFDVATTKLGPIIIYNHTELACPVENTPHSPPLYKCNVKPDMNSSLQILTMVNLTNAFYVDDEMFLRVNESINDQVAALDTVVLDLFCCDPNRLFSFVKGSIEIPLVRETTCVSDNQPRNDSLCGKSQRCPEHSLCSKVVNAEQRCVASENQLFVVMSNAKDTESFCKFESCLQEVLSDPENDCLSHYDGNCHVYQVLSRN